MCMCLGPGRGVIVYKKHLPKTATEDEKEGKRSKRKSCATSQSVCLFLFLEEPLFLPHIALTSVVDRRESSTAALSLLKLSTLVYAKNSHFKAAWLSRGIILPPHLLTKVRRQGGGVEDRQWGGGQEVVGVPAWLLALVRQHFVLISCSGDSCFCCCCCPDKTKHKQARGVGRA